MGVRIRTRRDGGDNSDEIFTCDEQAFAGLAKVLDVHLNDGHRIKRTGNSYLVTDGRGEFVQEIVLVRFFDEGPRGAE